MLKALCLADDLTGALEIGAIVGPPCVVSVDARVPADTSIAVVNVATRHMPERAAYEAVRQAVRDLPYLYLKTDSTLRGRVRASLNALLDALPDREVLYVPAYPALGRTVRDGCLYVHGCAVHETAFGRDALNPVRGSSIRELLEGLRGITIMDGETEADLDRAAERLRPGLIVVATAGFGSRWVRMVRRRSSTWVIAVGSLHPLSRAQAAGVPGVLLTPDEEIGNPLDVAERFGAEVARAVVEREAETLIVFGGDTAAAVLRALGCRFARGIDELMPGVPRSEIEAGERRVTLITKAGGFGDEDTLRRILAMLGIWP